MNLTKFRLKLISSFIITALILPAAAVYAKSPNVGSGLIKEQQSLTNKTARQQYKTEITAKKDTIKANEQTNKALRQTVAQKRESVKNLIQTIRKSKNQLNSNDLGNIQTALQTINNDISSLDSLNGSIKACYQSIKTDIASKNFEDAKAQLDKIISIQNTRTADLNNLSSDLDKIIGLLQTAQTNSKSATDSTAGIQ